MRFKVGIDLIITCKYFIHFEYTVTYCECVFLLGLSRLTAWSKTEDELGVVLNADTIPLLLSSLIECLFANNEYVRYVIQSQKHITMLPIFFVLTNIF